MIMVGDDKTQYSGFFPGPLSFTFLYIHRIRLLSKLLPAATFAPLYYYDLRVKIFYFVPPPIPRCRTRMAESPLVYLVYIPLSRHLPLFYSQRYIVTIRALQPRPNISAQYSQHPRLYVKVVGLVQGT